MTQFNELIGKTLTLIEVRDDEVIITAGHEKFRMYHSQDCCESVYVESVVGDLADIIGVPNLVAEESTSDTHPEGYEAKGYEDSFTWTFYRLATRKGWVVIRFLGESNGYYSEGVDFEAIGVAA
jgi:hypothetical protein